MSDESHAGHNKKYWAVGAVLFIFTVITVVVNQVHLGG